MVRIRGKAVATNAPPHGAFRGFGAPQSLFAMERHMDRIAHVVGLSPIEIRRRNFLKRALQRLAESGLGGAREVFLYDLSAESYLVSPYPDDEPQLHGRAEVSMASERRSGPHGRP